MTRKRRPVASAGVGSRAGVCPSHRLRAPVDLCQDRTVFEVPAQRRKATEQALSRPIGDTVEALGRLLEPGAALAAVLVEHVWAGVLEDAVARTGGTALASTFVESTTVADLGPQLLAAARSRRTSAAGR